MSRLLTTAVVGSAAFFAWLVVDGNSYPIPLRLWALIVFVLLLVSVFRLWQKK